MSSPANAQSNIPGSIGTRFADPIYVDTLIKSPCRQRPDTLLPCPLLTQHKDNPWCDECYLCGKGDSAKDIQELIKAVDSGKIRESYNRRSAKEKRKRKPCQFSGCTDGSQLKGWSKDKYCVRHTYIIKHRMNAGWPKDKWLDPVKPRRNTPKRNV